MEASSSPPGHLRGGIEASAGQQERMVGAAADAYMDLVLGDADPGPDILT